MERSEDRKIVPTYLSRGFTQMASGVISYIETDTFDDHWEYNDVEVSESKLEAARTFLEPMSNGLDPDKSSILDIGCGDGVHLNYLKSEYGDVILNNICAIDISHNVLAKNVQSYPSTVFVQDDAVDLHIDSNTFDYVISYGVLAYTSDIKKAIHEACRLVRPGGLVGLYIYTVDSKMKRSLFKFTRKVCDLVGDFWTRRIADLLVPLLPWLPTSSSVTLSNATWSQCREIILVNIAPEQLVIPTESELLSMLPDTMHISQNMDKFNTAIWLKKS